MTWERKTWGGGEICAGDTVRLPGRPETAAQVEGISGPLLWHAKTREYVRTSDGKTADFVAPHEHEDVQVRLVGRPGVLVFPAGAEVELLCDDALIERRVRVLVDSLRSVN